MATQPMLVGTTVLVVVDIQKGAFIEDHEGGIPHMPNYRENILRARRAIDAARAADVPIVFIQETHRPDFVDFGRELDGSETPHCIDGMPGTPVAAEEMDFRPDDYFVMKRRYSAFFGTDLEILLKGLGAQTLVLVGGLTDVCIHYTFVDAHQHDYYTRVAADAVAGSSLAAHEASLRAMEYLQTGAIRSVDEVVAGFEGLRAKVA